MPIFFISIGTKILTFFKNWRPSVLQIILALSILLNCFYFVSVNGFRLAPHIGPIRFTLISIEGYVPAIARLEKEKKDILDKGKENHNLQIDTNKETRIVSQSAAEATNEISTKSKKDVDEAVRKYIATHPVRSTDRLRCSKTDSVLDGKTSVPGTNSSSGSGNQEDLVPGFVSVTVDDFQHYNEAVKDLGELRAYIQALIDVGVFVPFEQTPSINKELSVPKDPNKTFNSETK